MQPLTTSQAVWAVLHAAPDTPWRQLADIVQKLAAQGVALVAMPVGTGWEPGPSTPVVDLTKPATAQPSYQWCRDRDGDYWYRIGNSNQFFRVQGTNPGSTGSYIADMYAAKPCLPPDWAR
jgi:hypothetical protein